MLVLLTSATATSDQIDRRHFMKVWERSDLDRTLAHRSVTHRRDVLLRRSQEIQTREDRNLSRLTRKVISVHWPQLAPLQPTPRPLTEKIPLCADR